MWVGWVGVCFIVGVFLVVVVFGFGLFVVVLGWAGVVFLVRDCERLLVAKDLAV